jgi:hypothetical protein
VCMLVPGAANTVPAGQCWCGIRKQPAGVWVLSRREQPG